METLKARRTDCNPTASVGQTCHEFADTFSFIYVFRYKQLDGMKYTKSALQILKFFTVITDYSPEAAACVMQ
jgi:hypothetical protein